MRIQIVSESNGTGLTRDLSILGDALRQCGCDVTLTAVDPRICRRRRSKVSDVELKMRAGMHRFRKYRYDLNLMLEHVWPSFLSDARLNCCIPNPEWFERRDRRRLYALDGIWAKTHYCSRLFKQFPCSSTYIGFDTEDCLLPEVPRERVFLHLSGKSFRKGTDRILQVWAQHPKWPKLIVVRHPGKDPIPVPQTENIEFRYGYIEQEELRTLQNRCRFHVCLSIAEGWGHYIVEPMSCGAVTLVVDAPPMNELIENGRGIPIAYSETGKQHLSTTFKFDKTAFEQAVENLIRMDNTELDRIGANARQWFLFNKKGFKDRLISALEPLLS